MNRLMRRGSGRTGSKNSYREGGAWAQGGEKQRKETRKRMGSYHGRLVGRRHARLGPGLVYRARLLVFQTFFVCFSSKCRLSRTLCLSLCPGQSGQLGAPLSRIAPRDVGRTAGRSVVTPWEVRGSRGTCQSLSARTPSPLQLRAGEGGAVSPPLLHHLPRLA